MDLSGIRQTLEQKGLNARIENDQVVAPLDKMQSAHFLNVQQSGAKKMVLGLYTIGKEQLSVIQRLEKPQQSAIIGEILDYLKKFPSKFQAIFQNGLVIVTSLDENKQNGLEECLNNVRTGLDLCDLKLKELVWLAERPLKTNDVAISRTLPFYIPDTANPFAVRMENYEVKIEVRNGPFIPNEFFVGLGRVVRPANSKIRFLSSASFPEERGSLVKLTISDFGDVAGERVDLVLRIASQAMNVFVQTFSYVTETYRNEDVVTQIPLESFCRCFHLRTATESWGYLTAVGKEYEVFDQQHVSSIQNILGLGGLEVHHQMVWESRVLYNLKNYNLAYVLLASAVDTSIQRALVAHVGNSNKCQLNPDNNVFELLSPKKNSFEECGFMRMLFDGIRYITGSDINHIPTLYDNMDILYGTRCNIVHSGIFEYKETLYHASKVGRNKAQLNQGGIDLVLTFPNILKDAIGLIGIFYH